MEFEPREYRYAERDVTLYALGIGAAKDPLDTKELQLVYERHKAGHKVLPTFGVLFPRMGLASLSQGLKFNLARMLHGEEYLEVLRPLPDEGTVVSKGRIKAVYDKGSGAVVVLEATTSDDKGQALTRHERSLFFRGLGGFGGDPGPSGKVNVPPERAPDQVHHEQVSPNQALLYRLSGDRNPLHIDPDVAKLGGFDRPILHGLCTYGFASRAVIKCYGDNDPHHLRSIKARFAQPFFPGETLLTEMWRMSDGHIVFQCKSAERGVVVLSNAVAEVV